MQYFFDIEKFILSRAMNIQQAHGSKYSANNHPTNCNKILQFLMQQYHKNLAIVGFLAYLEISRNKIIIKPKAKRILMIQFLLCHS